MLRNVTRLGAHLRTRQVYSRQFSALVYADHDNKTLSEATLSCITAAGKMDPDVHVLVAGQDCAAVAEQASKVAGVKNVVHVESAALGNHVAENATKVIVELQKQNGYTSILASATACGKNIMPRVAAALDVAPLTDVISVESADTFVRPIYAGNALATYKSNDAIKVLTTRSTSFENAAEGSGSASVEKVDLDCDAGMTAWQSNELSKSDRPELASAKVVVAGGRGVGSADNFKIINELADCLGGAVGASRAAVDAGYAVNDMQIGQTGKVVAPDLYVAAGISGAIQHLAGMKDSKVIVAINKDPEAAIFQVADYGLVGDLFDVVPALTKKIEADK